MRGRNIVLGSMLLWSLGIFSLACAAPCRQVTAVMTQEAILDRIRPVGTVETESGVVETKAANVVLDANAGEERYKTSCSVCHAAGIAGAPKYRNAADWKPRMVAGMDGLLKVAIQGKGGMPPKGTCMQCSDAELKAAIEYMLPQ